MHRIQALITRKRPLISEAGALRHAVVCPLPQDFALLPLTRAFVQGLADYGSGRSVPQPIEGLPNGLQLLALQLSSHEPVAYAETSYFGGDGGQEAIVWNRGALAFSPATEGYKQAWPNTSISQALRMIGVKAQNGMDEFDTVSLSRHRETSEWAASVK